MTDTTYNPDAALVPRFAATGGGSLGLRPGPLRGSVQDDQDWKLGGIVGCDGVFSTARNVAIFSQMILNGGVLRRRASLLDQKLRRRDGREPDAAGDRGRHRPRPDARTCSRRPRATGSSSGRTASRRAGCGCRAGSYGKSGGAGTYMWIDPKRDLIVVLLTNHGLPVPFDQPGWNRLADDVAMAEFVDGVVNAVS